MRREKIRVYEELEGFLRRLIFCGSRWRPATNTSLIITLTKYEGIRHRFWVNGSLIGMRDTIQYPDAKGIEGIRETCLMVEHVARFSSIQSLEAYVQSRLPYECMTQNEIHKVAAQIEHRFRVVGRTEVREFNLRRKIKRNKSTGRKLIVISLQWDMDGEETWGYSSWKAYFEENSERNVSFLTSRISCHIDIRHWNGCQLPSPWKFLRLPPNKMPPPQHDKLTTRALSWLQCCYDISLRKYGIIFSVEDDPISGLPEDVPDDVPMELIITAFNLLPPEKENCMRLIVKPFDLFSQRGMAVCTTRWLPLNPKNIISHYQRSKYSSSIYTWRLRMESQISYSSKILH